MAGPSDAGIGSFHAHRHSQGYQTISTLRFTNRPMMKVRRGPTADRATSRWPSLTGQRRPTASGQEKQGQRKEEAFLGAVAGGNLQRFGIQLAR